MDLGTKTPLQYAGIDIKELTSVETECFYFNVMKIHNLYDKITHNTFYYNSRYTTEYSIVPISHDEKEKFKSVFYYMISRIPSIYTTYFTFTDDINFIRDILNIEKDDIKDDIKEIISYGKKYNYETGEPRDVFSNIRCLKMLDYIDIYTDWFGIKHEYYEILFKFFYITIVFSGYNNCDISQCEDFNCGKCCRFNLHYVSHSYSYQTLWRCVDTLVNRMKILQADIEYSPDGTKYANIVESYNVKLKEYIGK